MKLKMIMFLLGLIKFSYSYSLIFKNMRLSDKYNLVFSQASLDNPYRSPFDAVDFKKHKFLLKKEREEYEREFQEKYHISSFLKLKDVWDEITNGNDLMYQHILYGFRNDIKIWEQEIKYFSSNEFLNPFLEEILSKSESKRYQNILDTFLSMTNLCNKDWSDKIRWDASIIMGDLVDAFYEKTKDIWDNDKWEWNTDSVEEKLYWIENELEKLQRDLEELEDWRYGDSPIYINRTDLSSRDPFHARADAYRANAQEIRGDKLINRRLSYPF